MVSTPAPHAQPETGTSGTSPALVSDPGASAHALSPASSPSCVTSSYHSSNSIHETSLGALPGA